MTIREKAEKEELDIEKVVEIATAAEINAEDLDRKLDQSEAGRLNYAVGQWKKGQEGGATEGKSETVRFWSTNQTHIIGAGILGKDYDSVKLEKHAIVLDAKADADKIERIRLLKTPDIFEVSDEPFDEDSDEYIKFDELLDELMITGHTGEKSKAGVIAVRALFSVDELADLKGEHAFEPRRLKAKALRSKSVVRLINNGK